MHRIKIIAVFIMLSFAVQIASALNVDDNFKESSVLAGGKWFKLAVVTEGVYKLDYSTIKNLGLENPSNPKIFGNNYGQLSYFNNDPKPDDLREVPVMFIYQNDSIFNEGDYLLFYAQGTHRWKYDDSSREYNFLRHNYSDTAYYFITSTASPAKRIANDNTEEVSVNYYSSASDALYIHEVENENIIKSGREWYEPISTQRDILLNPGFPGLITSEKVKFTMRLLARSSVPTSFRLYEGQSLLTSKMISEVNMNTTTGAYARIDSVSGSSFPLTNSPGYVIRYFNNGESGSKAWIDYVILQARIKTSFSGNTVKFMDSKSVSAGNVTEFSITTSVNNVLIWNISDPFNVKKVVYEVRNDQLFYRAKTDSLKTYLAFTKDKALVPVLFPTPVKNQNLHSSGPADMIIVSHPMFLEYASKLAEIHFRNSGLVSLIITPQQVYNEFSGGVPDIAAIRNFLKMMFKKYSGNAHSTKYLLLFGDGSFENKTLPPFNPNFIPTYQTKNSNVFVSSFTSDDFYSLLEDGEGEFYGTEDLGVGRLPVSDTAQAGAIVRKIERYLDPSNSGKWRNIISIAADDEDGNSHMIDAEGLAGILENNYPSFNVEKIYLDAYSQESSVNGQSYPDVNKAINDRINAGCLIFNYLGHGNELGLAHERVVNTEDINSWKNNSFLPLFITATCEFSRFDDIDVNMLTGQISGKNSAGEMVLNNPYGGGIALMTTTRIVYSSPNYILNKEIYENAFSLDSEGKGLRLGDIIRLAKISSGDGMNKRNFSLLGDPAVRLAHPWNGKVITDSVNNASISQSIDSLRALSLVTISGHITDNSGSLNSNYDGIVYPIVYDKKSELRTLANDGGNTFEYDTQNSLLFSGRTSVRNGLFSFTFMVPRDINFNYGQGKISYYATDESSHTSGYFNDFIVGGFNRNTLTDTTGPSIELFLNDTLFLNGGITDRYPVLLARIEDEGGINTTGSGIGHDITVKLNEADNQKLVLNNYFETASDNFRKGQLEYNLGEMDGGKSSLTLKAWDNFNNSSEESLIFIVTTEDGFILKDLINYPNPFENETNFTAEHNRPDNELDIKIYIHNLNGAVIKIIKTTVLSTGYKIPPIHWDGLSDGGDKTARGVYPYRIEVTNKEGETAVAGGRLIIL